LTDAEGRPVSVEVFPATPRTDAFISALEACAPIWLNEVVMVGDRA